MCRSVAAVVSALLRGHPVIVGRDGHAICYVRPTYRRGALSVIYANSWGQWGVGVGPWEYGFGLDSARQLERASTWAVAVRTVNFAHDAIDVTHSQMRGDHCMTKRQKAVVQAAVHEAEQCILNGITDYDDIRRHVREALNQKFGDRYKLEWSLVLLILQIVIPLILKWIEERQQ
ncbi:MAG: hypothetical protein KatS3mg038_2964 [Candidatus Kapaibacterium sp.]|nr:MAG: hypothetical protein KatS3mg038_2964 [Candidatus Kapabacteria bacterium]